MLYQPLPCTQSIGLVRTESVPLNNLRLTLGDERWWLVAVINFDA